MIEGNIVRDLRFSLYLCYSDTIIASNSFFLKKICLGIFVRARPTSTLPQIKTVCMCVDFWPMIDDAQQ